MTAIFDWYRVSCHLLQCNVIFSNVTQCDRSSVSTIDSTSTRCGALAPAPVSLHDTRPDEGPPSRKLVCGVSRIDCLFERSRSRGTASTAPFSLGLGFCMLADRLSHFGLCSFVVGITSAQIGYIEVQRSPTHLRFFQGARFRRAALSRQAGELIRLITSRGGGSVNPECMRL